MNFPRSRFAHRHVWILALAVALSPALAGAGEVHFQKPSRGTSPAKSSTGLEFRRASTAAEPAANRQAAKVARPAAAPQVASAPITAAPRPVRPAAKPLAHAEREAPVVQAVRPSFAQPSQGGAVLADYRSDDDASSNVVAIGHNEPWQLGPEQASRVTPAGFSSLCPDCCEPACGCAEPECGICEPACGLVEPGCGLVEPGCGMEPDCGLIEPGCGLMEPTCGCGEVECGNCVGRSGPDYWCFPVCLPRFKDFIVWGGVHGFKGPRDSPDFGRDGDGNFGFQEGFNLGGRAPLIGLILPQISYQVGFQGVQSQLSGTSGNDTDDRSQSFVTAGLFRRVPAGLQFGLVWDLMRDDLIQEADFKQLRYEVSIKGRRGHEFGFWGATHNNSKTIATGGPAGHVEFQTVDQYCGFIRCHFRDGGEARLWGGATNDNEGIVGADVQVPLNYRWSVQSGFNYLITDLAAGSDAAREESWNVGMNLVWHFGKTAKAFRSNPHRPLFETADNGWMFVDQKP